MVLPPPQDPQLFWWCFSCLLGVPQGWDHFLRHEASNQAAAYADAIDALQLDIYSFAALRADLGLTAAAAVSVVYSKR